MKNPIFTQKIDKDKTVHLFLDCDDFSLKYKIPKRDFVQCKQMFGQSRQFLIKRAKSTMMDCYLAHQDGLKFLGIGEKMQKLWRKHNEH